MKYLIGILIILILVFVWPTLYTSPVPYSYGYMKENRITGTTYLNPGSGWVRMD